MNLRNNKYKKKKRPEEKNEGWKDYKEPEKARHGVSTKELISYVQKVLGVDKNK